MVTYLGRGDSTVVAFDVDLFEQLDGRTAVPFSLSAEADSTFSESRNRFGSRFTTLRGDGYACCMMA